MNDANRIGAVNPYQKQSEFRSDNTKKTPKKDEVQISAAAKEMLSTSKLNDAERSEHIASLKQAISSGTYHVETGKIAEKLLPYLKE